MSLRTLSLLALVLAASSALLVQAEDVAEPEDFVGLEDRQARSNDDQSITIGYINANDRVLATKTVFKSSTFLMKHTETVTMSVSNGVISGILVDDLMRNGDNARVQVVAGGPGQSSVTLKFKSQRGERINYNVTLYGR